MERKILPNHIYLFEMKNNKKKLAYGQTPEDALEILGTRLTTLEMKQICQDRYKRINRKDLLKHIDQLG